ncbi:hypothetical protein CR970_00075 [Candidatus Saccharibacteria bacterium]|nr:MAG: hypothetical protein CR970_00075 [Candidatus Saccharibacteria bacterium]
MPKPEIQPELISDFLPSGGGQLPAGELAGHVDTMSVPAFFAGGEDLLPRPPVSEQPVYQESSPVLPPDVSHPVLSRSSERLADGKDRTDRSMLAERLKDRAGFIGDLGLGVAIVLGGMAAANTYEAQHAETAAVADEKRTTAVGSGAGAVVVSAGTAAVVVYANRRARNAAETGSAARRERSAQTP